jgi:small subunit ribosomal protein S2
MEDGTAKTMSKRERLQMTRQKDKMQKVIGSIADMTRLPAAVFVVDVRKEHIAVAESRKLGIPVFAMVDTNSDPKPIDFVIPANDDATKSIDLIVGLMCDAIKEGLSERKAGKEKAAEKTAEAPTAEKAAEAPVVEAKVEEVVAEKAVEKK